MWTDVDLEKGTISVNKSIDDDNDMKINYDDPKTDRSVRTIELSDRSTERLKDIKPNTLLIVSLYFLMQEVIKMEVRFYALTQ